MKTLLLCPFINSGDVVKPVCQPATKCTCILKIVEEEQCFFYNEHLTRSYQQSKKATFLMYSFYTYSKKIITYIRKEVGIKFSYD